MSLEELQGEFRHLYKRMVELGERIAIYETETPPSTKPKERPKPGHSRHIPGDWFPSRLPWLGEISVYRATVERKGGLEQCWAIQWTRSTEMASGNHANFFGESAEEFAKESVLGILALRERSHDRNSDRPNQD